MTAEQTPKKKEEEWEKQLMEICACQGIPELPSFPLSLKDEEEGENGEGED